MTRHVQILIAGEDRSLALLEVVELAKTKIEEDFVGRHWTDESTEGIRKIIDRILAKAYVAGKLKEIRRAVYYDGKFVVI